MSRPQQCAGTAVAPPPPSPARVAPRPSPLRQRMLHDMELAGLCPCTKAHYVGAVVQLQGHYQVRPDQLTEEQVYRYLLWLRDERQVPRGTFQTHFYGLRFFYFCSLAVDWPLFTRKKVRLPVRRSLPRLIAWEDARRLLAGLEHPGHRLCCTCMLTLGLRIGDVVRLTVQAIDSRQMVVRVLGKGNKERVVPLPPRLLEALRQYWRTHRHSRWLFPNRTGTACLSRQTLHCAFALARDRLGLDRTLTPHVLRHTFATTLLQQGTDIRYVQLLLGHSTLAATQIYTHLTTPMQDQLRQQLHRLCTGLLPEAGRDE